MKHSHFGDWGHPAPHGKLMPFRFWVQQTLPSLYDDSLSYLELASRLNWYIEQIINTLKVYDDKFCELMGLYTELEDYVRCYLDHTDFPEMVKDILDDMVVTGKLSDILANELKDFSIDARKIKNGIVQVHYKYVKTEGGNEYYAREEKDSEVLDMLRNGSVILGVFQNSPTFGTFTALEKYASYIYEGSYEKEFECGCVNTVYTKDFNIVFEDFVQMEEEYLPGKKDWFIFHREIKDLYNQDLVMQALVHSYATLPDGNVTTDKMADGAVTTPKLKDGSVTTAKLADNSVTSAKIKDGEVKTSDIADGAVTHAKIGAKAVGAKNITDNAVLPNHVTKKAYIFIGDSYGAGYGGTTSWITRVGQMCGLTANAFKVGGGFYFSSAVTGSGFIGQSGVKTFLQQLQDVHTTIASKTGAHADGFNDDGIAMSDYITDIIVCGGWNDQGKDESALSSAMGAFASYAKTNFKNATIHVGFIAGEDFQKRYDRGDGPNQAGVWAAIEKYSRLSGENGMAYITNSEYILHRWDWFQADGVHPTDEGQKQIARYISSYVKGGGVDVVHGFEVVTSQVTLASGVSNNVSDWMVSTWQNNNRCGIWINHNHWHFSSPVSFSGHPADDANGTGTKTLFTLPNNTYVQGGQYQGMTVFVPATFKVSGQNVYYTRMTQLRLLRKEFVIIPISTNEGSGSNPYDPLENISDVIFQVDTLRIEGEALFN